MNTEQMSELFFLHTMVNDPIKYDSNDETQATAEPAEESADPLSWLYKALDWLYASARRTRPVLPSA